MRGEGGASVRALAPRRVSSFVGWAKARSAVPTLYGFPSRLNRVGFASLSTTLQTKGEAERRQTLIRILRILADAARALQGALACRRSTAALT